MPFPTLVEFPSDLTTRARSLTWASVAVRMCPKCLVHISRLNLSLSFLFDLYIGSCDYVKDVHLGQDILNYWTYSSDGLHLLTSHPYMTLPYISRSTDFVKICFKSISQKLLVLQPVILDICTFYHGLFSAVINN